jgi:hypothetical protein
MVQGRNEMEMRYRYYFIEALALTLFLFIIGFLIGLNIEHNRNVEITEYYMNTEESLGILTDKLALSNLGKYTCSELITQNFEIGNQIYEQALIFERYENSATFTKSQLIGEHRKFDVLRTMFWTNSIKIKERCGEDSFNTIVYLYNYQSEEIEEIAKQKIMSSITQEIKEKAKEKIILIPIAKNLNISSLNVMMSEYDNLNESTLLIVNEDLTFLANQTEDLRKYFKIDL